MKNSKLQTIEVTMQEIWAHTKHTVQKDRTKYTRKDKHKNRKS